jgi:predicted branched-subunit amino acid permease
MLFPPPGVHGLIRTLGRRANAAPGYASADRAATGLALAASWAFIIFVAPAVRVTDRQHAVAFTLTLIISVVAAFFGVIGWIWVPIILGLGTLINWSMQMKVLNNRIKRGDSPESTLE